VGEPNSVGILVVEDDLSIRRLLQTVLQREGFRIETASDGIEAVLKLGLCDYDVIVLDLMMPNLDGFAFIDSLREHDPERLERIIVMSAASPAIIRERLHGKPFAVVPKPFDLDELVAKIRDCVQNCAR
jgi:DNA-binding response OmpR family regulator